MIFALPFLAVGAEGLIVISVPSSVATMANSDGVEELLGMRPLPCLSEL